LTDGTRTIGFGLIVVLTTGVERNFELLIELLKEKITIRTAEERDKLKLVKPTERKQAYAGLQNLNNVTCYASSLLQQFFMIPSLRYGLLNVQPVDDSEIDSKEPVEPPTSDSVVPSAPVDDNIPVNPPVELGEELPPKLSEDTVNPCPTLDANKEAPTEISLTKKPDPPVDSQETPTPTPNTEAVTDAVTAPIETQNNPTYTSEFNSREIVPAHMPPVAIQKKRETKLPSLLAELQKMFLSLQVRATRALLSSPMTYTDSVHP